MAHPPPQKHRAGAALASVIRRTQRQHPPRQSVNYRVDRDRIKNVRVGTRLLGESDARRTKYWAMAFKKPDAWSTAAKSDI